MCCATGLYGVVEHQGRLHGGHYVCYVQNGGGDWWHISDAHASPAAVTQVLAAQAYLLFYRRLAA